MASDQNKQLGGHQARYHDHFSKPSMKAQQGKRPVSLVQAHTSFQRSALAGVLSSRVCKGWRLDRSGRCSTTA